MAKGAYIGVAGAARKVTAAYIGVAGTARKARKSYIGVNGVARESFGVSLPQSFNALFRIYIDSKYGDEISECALTFSPGFPGYRAGGTITPSANGQAMIMSCKLSGIPSGVVEAASSLQIVAHSERYPLERSDMDGVFVLTPPGPFTVRETTDFAVEIGM